MSTIRKVENRSNWKSTVRPCKYSTAEWHDEPFVTLSDDKNLERHDYEDKYNTTEKIEEILKSLDSLHLNSNVRKEEILQLEAQLEVVMHPTLTHVTKRRLSLPLYKKPKSTTPKRSSVSTFSNLEKCNHASATKYFQNAGSPPPRNRRSSRRFTSIPNTNFTREQCPTSHFANSSSFTPHRHKQNPYVEPKDMDCEVNRIINKYEHVLKTSESTSDIKNVSIRQKFKYQIKPRKLDMVPEANYFESNDLSVNSNSAASTSCSKRRASLKTFQTKIASDIHSLPYWKSAKAESSRRRSLPNKHFLWNDGNPVANYGKS